MSLDPAIEEAPKKLYVAYKTSENIICMEVQKQKVLLFLKLDPKTNPGPPNMARDVSNTGHFGTGDLQLTLKTVGDVDVAKPLLEKAYRAVGG